MQKKVFIQTPSLYNTEGSVSGHSNTILLSTTTIPTPAGDPASPPLYTAVNPLSRSQRLLSKVEHAAGAKVSALLAGGQLICVENRPWQEGKAGSVLRCNRKPPKSIISLFRRRVSCSFQGTESADFSAGKQQPLTHSDTCSESDS